MHSNNELLHPLWLGLLILINVILILAILCCLRRKYARRFCRHNPHDEQITVPSSSPVLHWRNISNPSAHPTIRRSPSPKLYQLIKTMKTAAGTQKEHQRAEVARKFYASMRYVSQSEEMIDVEKIPSKREENLRLFQTPRFFQSITDAEQS